MRTALVTGTTGFIGRHVVKGLRTRGIAVRVLARSPEKAGHLAAEAARARLGLGFAPAASIDDRLAETAQ